MAYVDWLHNLSDPEGANPQRLAMLTTMWSRSHLLDCLDFDSSGQRPVLIVALSGSVA